MLLLIYLDLVKNLIEKLNLRIHFAFKSIKAEIKKSENKICKNN